MKVLVIGYYHRKNLGDDVFEKVFSDYLESRKYTPVIKNIDDLSCIPEDVSCILFGGGDLINTYFVNKLNRIIAKSNINRRLPIYAIGIGIPYPSTIKEGYLDRFDYIATRSNQDEHLLDPVYGKRSTYSPDLSLLLPKNCSKHNFPSIHSKSKKIGIFLARTLYSVKNPSVYETILENLSTFFQYLLNKNISCCYDNIPEYELYLVPFCTEDKDKHDDRIINQHIFDKLSNFENSAKPNSKFLSSNNFKNLHLMNSEISVENVRAFFDFFDYTICTRFHAHMFSLISETPFLSIYTTKKVENILIENEHQDYAIKMEIDPEQYYPTFVDSRLCIERFEKLKDDTQLVKNKLEKAHLKYEREVHQFLNKIDNLLFDLPIHPPNHIPYLISDTIQKIIDVLISHESLYIYNLHTDDLIYGKGMIKRHFGELNKKNVVSVISYFTTGKKESPYNYGLEQQIFTEDYCLFDSISWIIKHKYQSYSKDTPLDINLDNKVPVELRKIKIENADIFQGYHRSGWSYVLSHLKDYNSSQMDEHYNNGIIFDSYLDRTFGWDNDILSFVNKIPYLSPWIGVLHHTNNQSNDYDLSSCINNPNFIDSLPYCKGLIVLSKINKEFLESELNIPVIHLTHPTELEDIELFDYKRFLESPIKQIVQIGAWLRNPYAIYDLKLDKFCGTQNHDKFCGKQNHNIWLKLALKGKSMENYFIDDNTWNKIIECILSCSGNYECVSGNLIERKHINKHALGLLESITKERESVYVLSNISNFAYDKLLKTSVVFLNLIDAAAVNTIIECIARNTPVVVNRLPATEEYLGRDYPLFYNDIDEVKNLLTNKRILKAHKYLKNMDKTQFSIGYFLRMVNQIIQ